MDYWGRLSSSPLTREGLVISGGEVEALSSPYFGAVAITLENRSARWIRIRKMSVSFGGGPSDRAVFVPTGEELWSWELATLQRNEIRAVNEATALGIVAVAGAFTEAVGKKKPVGAVGGLVATAALAGITSEGVDAAVSSAENPSLVPERHLLSVPFSVPPGLFSKRWIVLNTAPRSSCIDSMLLDYETEDGIRERAWLTFRKRSRYMHTEWQPRECRKRS